MPDVPDRFRAHTVRVTMLRRVADEPMASYWQGYRMGMLRAARGDVTPRSSEDEVADGNVAAALAGDREGRDDATYARWCGYHDGMEWEDVTLHRGLLRLAIAVSGESNRGFARGRLGIDDGAVRQMLAGTRPVPATRYTELLDIVQGG